MEPGARVRVLAPFDGAFPGVYTIESIAGTTAFLGGIPDGFANAFDLAYLEAE